LVVWVERKTSIQNKVVVQGEGRGKLSSPHLVNILGTKILPKWGDMIWIGSFYYFSSFSMLSKWKKMEESTCRVNLMVGPSLENWGLKPFRAILRHQTTCFGINTFPMVSRAL
jgi:hypothetical protein